MQKVKETKKELQNLLQREKDLTLAEIHNFLSFHSDVICDVSVLRRAKMTSDILRLLDIADDKDEILKELRKKDEK